MTWGSLEDGEAGFRVCWGVMRWTWISPLLLMEADEELEELRRLVIDCLSKPTVCAHLTWGDAGQSPESTIFLDFFGDSLLRAVFEWMTAGEVRNFFSPKGSNLCLTEVIRFEGNGAKLSENAMMVVGGR